MPKKTGEKIIKINCQKFNEYASFIPEKNNTVIHKNVKNEASPKRSVDWLIQKVDTIETGKSKKIGVKDKQDMLRTVFVSISLQKNDTMNCISAR